MFFTLILLSCTLSTLAQNYDEPQFIGCYTHFTRAKFNFVDGKRSTQQCVSECQNKYYRYANIQVDNNCTCGNYLGDFKDTNNCKVFCSGCDQQNDLVDVYSTRILGNGPPINLIIENVTDTQAHLAWDEPESYITIDMYKIVARAIFTYSHIKLGDLIWTQPNSTRIELINLNPGTKYNVSIQAVSKENDGAPVHATFETDIGEPDHVPFEPKIVERIEKGMKIQLKPVENSNGPITSYLIIVINSGLWQTVQVDNLKGYYQAKAEGFSYYVAAEIQPTNINELFTIGDGRNYGKYYNAPLDKDSVYKVMLGAVSKSKGIEKRIFSESNIGSDVTILEMENEGQSESPIIITFLWIAIILITLLLIAGLGLIFLLRKRLHRRNRQRLNDNQELTLQGPIIDLENNGYIHDEEGESTSHYKKLKEKIWLIPRNLLNIDLNNLLGIGSFGKVFEGNVMRDSNWSPASVYCIEDRSLEKEDKRVMLKDLDLLIKARKHQNVLELIGTCETPENVFVVLEHSSVNLKELLLNSRILINNRFTNLSESQCIDFGIDIAKGMEFLHERKIVHKKLCSIHVVVINGNCAKISGFGLAKYYKTDQTPDFSRFTAMEVFRGQQHVSKSDVWAFACILWEISALGGTPYGNISRNELPEKVIRGLRLSQLPYLEDSLYQIMLNCWQLDLDERPTFAELIETLLQLKSESFLNFAMFEGFQYEPYYLELDMLRGSNY
ncbi:PREDICTED: putative tyrosine-protein kinase Wsck [Nicrophorus vespilloides]|uniref:Tyrosine-protein kinase Wsck n=1 Tax=Nicrophorus vespilloides TaxID=110193 RepID=A0ABM1NFC2_NICVS|nr:PREDICTED: putative tyrosine-protein kinase Wsck [Nicrophorus vespilloides]